MTYQINRRSERDRLNPEHVPAHMRGGVSGTARGYEEADEMVRRYDRRSEGGPAMRPVLVTDEKENERVELEDHTRALGEERAAALMATRSSNGRKRVIYGPIS